VTTILVLFVAIKMPI